MRSLMLGGLPRPVWLALWLSVALLALLNLRSGRPGLNRLSELELVLWAAGYLAFGLGFWWASLEPGAPGSLGVRARLGLTLGMSVTVIGLAAIMPQYGGHGQLLVMTAALAAAQLPMGAALGWVVAQGIAFALVLLPNEGLAGALYLSLAFTVVCVFAVAAVRAVVRERQAREDLAHINAELVAARSKLEAASRNAERVRIARELHDLLGHHLTALNLNLEAAEHLIRDPVGLQPVARAHAVARLLLADVRDAVGSMRDAAPTDLATAGRALLADLPGLQVHVNFDPAMPPLEPDRSRALLRCLQEVATNTLRHAGASQLWVRLEGCSQGVRLEARDDGRGANTVHPGNGLCGMRERLEGLGGSLEVQTAPGQGFDVRAWLPVTSRGER